MSEPVLKWWPAGWEMRRSREQAGPLASGWVFRVKRGPLLFFGSWSRSHVKPGPAFLSGTVRVPDAEALAFLQRNPIPEHLK